MTYMGKESKKRVDMCITGSLCCIPETNRTLYVNYTLIKSNKKSFMKCARHLMYVQPDMTEVI